MSNRLLSGVVGICLASSPRRYQMATSRGQTASSVTPAPGGTSLAFQDAPARHANVLRHCFQRCLSS